MDTKHRKIENFKTQVQELLHTGYSKQELITLILGTTESTDITDKDTNTNELYDNTVALINASIDSALMIDRNGIIIECNNQFAQNNGTTRGKIIGTNVFSLFDDELAISRKIRVEEMFSTGKPMKFSDIRNGKYFDICLYPVRDIRGEVFRAAVYARETTKEKTAIQKLKESEEKLRHFAEMLPETVFETDENENIIFININGLRMFEYFSLDFEKGIKFFNLIHPFEKNNIKNYFRLNTKKLSSFSFKCTGISKSGNAFPISVHANSIFQDGDFKGVRGIIIDETKHQKIEKALIESEQRFKEADRTKSKLFSILAHDLRGPFSGFINLTETLANGLEQLEFNEIKELSGSMHISALNLYRLLDNLLSWARNQTGSLQTCVSCFHLKKVISDVVNYHYLNYTHKNLEVCIDVPDTLKLSADKNMIKTVFRNLFSNAIKFSNPSGKIEISAFMSEKHVVIKFSDNGIGISSRRLEKLFELNVVEYSSGTRYESGTGLGMLVTKEFVEANNGSIKVESIEGEGTVITIMLPA